MHRDRGTFIVPAHNGGEVISVENLTKRYGPRTAVSDLEFSVDRGEIVGFLGPNGAGKSTTLRMIAGVLAPTTGRVRIDGFDVHEEPKKARARFGYMPEQVPMYPEMRVHEYLEYRSRLKGLPFRDRKKNAEGVLELAGVSDAKMRIIGQLSKGYRQRVGIADALLGDPPLLILDEPTSGLDPNQMRHIRALVRSFAGKKTVFLSTHILPEVESTCERVVIIRNGRKVAEGDVATLRARSKGEQLVRLVGLGAFAPIQAALSGVRGVKRVVEVEAGASGVSGATVTAEPGDETLDAVFRAVVDAGLSLREFRREQASLEEVFADLTVEQDDDGPIDPVPVEAPSEEETAADAADQTKSEEETER